MGFAYSIATISASSPTKFFREIREKTLDFPSHIFIRDPPWNLFKRSKQKGRYQIANSACKSVHLNSNALTRSSK
jgi:hypothetical protein